MFKLFILCSMAVGFLVSASLPVYAVNPKDNSLLTITTYQVKKDHHKGYIVLVHRKAVNCHKDHDCGPKPAK